MSGRIMLSVGGTYFETTSTTLRAKDSFFCGLCESNRNPEDIIFIDRDPKHFRYILNYLRGSDVLPEDILDLNELIVEADFYSLNDLCDSIKTKLNSYNYANLQSIPVILNKICNKL